MDPVYEFLVTVLSPLALFAFTAGAVYRIGRLVACRRRYAWPQRRRRGLVDLVIGLARTIIDPIVFSAEHLKKDFVFGLFALHICGILPVLFLLPHHIAFFERFIPFYGVLWPLAIPPSPTSLQASGSSSFWAPAAFIVNGEVLGVIGLIGVIVKVLMKCVEKKVGRCNVRTGDILVYALLVEVLVSGLLAANDPWQGALRMVFLDMHVGGALILLAVLPFTKYWHFVFAYWYGKLHEWWDLKVRRGVV